MISLNPSRLASFLNPNATLLSLHISKRGPVEPHSPGIDPGPLPAPNPGPHPEPDPFPALPTEPDPEPQLPPGPLPTPAPVT